MSQRGRCAVGSEKQHSTRGILLFIDIKHEGWGPYYSRITELCTKVAVFDLANGEGEELLEAGE